MLINFSNHPAESWPKNQLSTALLKYGTVSDLKFPQINPDLSGADVSNLAKKYEDIIKSMNPTAVHIMGELTFTFSLVNRLLRAGIPCIASTASRNVTFEEAGIKTSIFEFIQFRNYQMD